MRFPQRKQVTIYSGNEKELIIYVVGDHTGRKLSLVAKLDRDPASAIVLQKDNTLAGGGDTEILAELIESLTPDKTRITVYFVADDTKSASAVWNVLQFDLDSTDDDDSDDVQTLATGRIVRQQNVNVAPTGVYNKSTLSLAKYAHWQLASGVLTVKAMNGWDSDPTAALDGSKITITSSGGEIPDGALFDSSYKDFYTGVWTTSSREIFFEDVTGKTIDFWIEYYE